MWRSPDLKFWLLCIAALAVAVLGYWLLMNTADGSGILWGGGLLVVGLVMVAGLAQYARYFWPLREEEHDAESPPTDPPSH
jgi:hypothetical protein